MNGKKDREEKIIYLVDKLIETAMSLSLWEQEGPTPAPLEQGVTIVNELIETLLPELKGNEQYLLQVIQQLTAQKLPDRQILHSFGSFSDVLYQLIERGVNEFELKNLVSEAVVAETLMEDAQPVEPLPVVVEKQGQDPLWEEVGPELPVVTADVPAPVSKESLPPELAAEPEMVLEEEAQPSDPFLAALSMVYPHSEILPDYLLNKYRLQYYLPGEQLAIEVGDTGGLRQLKKEYYCEQEGIKLLYLNPEEFANPRQLARILRRLRVG